MRKKRTVFGPEIFGVGHTSVEKIANKVKLFDAMYVIYKILLAEAQKQTDENKITDELNEMINETNPAIEHILKVLL